MNDIIDGKKRINEASESSSEIRYSPFWCLEQTADLPAYLK